MSEPCVMEAEIAKISANLENLKTNFEQFKSNDFHEVKENLNCIILKMSRQRLPLWATWILTGCSALITGLIITLLK